MSDNEAWLRSIGLGGGYPLNPGTDARFRACADEIKELRSRLDSCERELAMATDAANKGDAARLNAAAMEAQIEDLQSRLSEYRNRSIDRGELGSACRLCKGTWSHMRGAEWHEDWCPNALIAQLAEHDASNVGAAGSSPAERSTSLPECRTDECGATARIDGYCESCAQVVERHVQLWSCSRQPVGASQEAPSEWRFAETRQRNDQHFSAHVHVPG